MRDKEPNGETVTQGKGQRRHSYLRPELQVLGRVEDITRQSGDLTDDGLLGSQPLPPSE